jgi:putative endonuclease
VLTQAARHAHEPYLCSLKDKKFYTGYTQDLEGRLQEHFQGNVGSTRGRRPLRLTYYEACLEQADALHGEKYLKTTWGKRYLKNRLRTSLKLIRD